MFRPQRSYLQATEVHKIKITIPSSFLYAYIVISVFVCYSIYIDMKNQNVVICKSNKELQLKKYIRSK